MTASPDKSQFGKPPEPERTGNAFRELCEVIAKLRAPDGCPWDREQTLETIKPYTLEETYELLEAIDTGNDDEIVEELGDLLLQVVLDAQIGADENRFVLADVIEGVSAKLVRRHPHVFGDAQAHNADDVLRNWERERSREKERESLLDGIPAALPQLARAARITKRAAKVGYDFPVREMLFDKLREELDELQAELYPTGKAPEVPAGVDAEVVPDQPIDDPQKLSRVEDEIGDVLFVLANIARRWGVNPEEALRRSNQKFTRRFRGIEQVLAAAGKDIHAASLREMEDAYQECKRSEA